MQARLVSVALPVPLLTPFTYRVPPSVPWPERGARVLVPLGRRRMIGVVVGPATAAPAELEAKDVLDVLDPVPLVSGTLVDLAAWLAAYYLAAPGEALRLVFPPSGVKASRTMVRLADVAGGSSDEGDPLLAALRPGPLPLSTLARRLGSDPASRVLRLRESGRVVIEQRIEAGGFREVRHALLADPAAQGRGRAQVAVLERLREAGGRLAVPELVRERASWRGALDRLVERGAVRINRERERRRPDVLPGGTSEALCLSGEQARVAEALTTRLERGSFEACLLHGVTGSGKTEIYFRLAERALERGRGALVLVPEIALTPFLVRAATARFGATVAVLHSDLSEGERHDEWWRIRDGAARVVIGARSAVFAPVAPLGLLVVDEEHEAAYKQEDSPRYHARDVAVMRGKLEGALVVLGSATPSVESYANALAGKYAHFELHERVLDRALPRVEIVDRREVLRAGGDPILTPPLVEALGARLGRGEQALLLLNRRGYATSLLCRECGMQASCPNCSVSLTVHRAGATTECHYCGFESRSPTTCPSCHGAYLKLTGHGTEKVLEAVHAVFPGARVERVDRDLARRRGALGRTLAAFERGDLDILVGTQMIAKGHDFPRVTLVGVIDADVGLGLPDFRSAERTFQLLTQVAGRAGRGERSGEVILQSHRPDHYALGFACAQDYASFFEREMEFRRTMGYPPASALLNLVLRSTDAEAVLRDARAIAARLRERARGGYRVLGPAFAPLARLRREHRCQVLLKGRRKTMREAVREVLSQRRGGVSWRGITVDVDPVSLM
jgi:primosomal protein N' (replication factor Y)